MTEDEKLEAAAKKHTEPLQRTILTDNGLSFEGKYIIAAQEDGFKAGYRIAMKEPLNRDDARVKDLIETIEYYIGLTGGHDNDYPRVGREALAAFDKQRGEG